MKLKIDNPHNVNSALSQKISWGHWFLLLNILITIFLGSQYLRIADWPPTFIGRFYAIISSIGQFSFLCFALYLITLFPISFVIRRPRFFFMIGSVVATSGIAFLLIDIEIFSRFRMHMNAAIWEIFTTARQDHVIRQSLKFFILVPLIFLFEYLAALWIWQRLRQLKQWRNYAKPLVALFIICFLSFHFIHIWADAHFYRSITMQRASLPLSYPLTARHLLKKYGLMVANNETKRSSSDSAFPAAVQYPLGDINYKTGTKSYNLLLITIDKLASTSIDDMSHLRQFYNSHFYFRQHYTSHAVNLSLFSLFYGIDANYYRTIVASATKSAFLDMLVKQHYHLGFFSTDAFKAPVYQSALLSDFSLPVAQGRTNEEITTNWLMWLNELNTISNDIKWFSFVNYQIADKNIPLINKNNLSLQAYRKSIKNIDKQINTVINQLKIKGLLKDTIIVITANGGLDLSADQISLSDSVDHFDRDLFSVPLVIAWPNKPAGKKIDILTTHTDIMRTLMENMLHVITVPSEYSQGLNLFTLPEQRDWVIAANEKNIIAFYRDRSIIIDNVGHYCIYDRDSRRLVNEKLNLALFLELLTNNRRFMVLN